MKPGRTWLVYTLIRLGIFAVALTVLLLLQIEQWIAAVVAAIIALCVSVIFLRRPREAASQTLYEARENRGRASSPAPTGRTEDEDIEDQAVDQAVEPEAAAATTGAGEQLGAQPGEAGAPTAAVDRPVANDPVEVDAVERPSSAPSASRVSGTE